METKYNLNDRIKLYDGDYAIIKFIGKTRLDATIWFGIEYLSSLISPFKPTLITSADIKSSKTKSSRTYTPKRVSKKHKKTSSSILYTTKIQKLSKSSRKSKSTLNPLNSSSASDLNSYTFKKHVKASIKSKSARKKQKNSRSSSVPSKDIQAYLHSMDTMDINNTIALNNEFDNIASTIDFPDENEIIKNKKLKIKKKKRRKNYHSDIRDSILSSPSLKKKTVSKRNKSKNKSVPTLSMNGSIEHGLNINFDKKQKKKVKTKDDMPLINPVFTGSKSDESNKLSYNSNNVKHMSSSKSTNIEFAALIEDENIVLNEEKEIENDIDYKSQYSNIFTSIKSGTGTSKSLALAELKKSIGGKTVMNGDKKKSVKKHGGSGSLKKLKLNRKDSKKINDSEKEDVMD